MMQLCQKYKRLLAALIIPTAVIAILLLAGKFLGSAPKKIEFGNNSDENRNDDAEERNEDEVLGNFEVAEKKLEEPAKQEKNITNLQKTEENNDEKNYLDITSRLTDWGFEKASSRTIDTIIIHSSYDAIGNDPFDVSGLIKEYRSYEVAPHYLIDRTGKVYRLVEEKNIAYHAGVSSLPDGRTSVNEISIGIELMNTKDGNFTEKQYDSLNNMLKYIKGRYKIKYVLGHNQIATGRKDDPWNFDWKKID